VSVSVVSWPDHLLSLDDWDALPEDTSRRYEVAEGVLQVSPRPASSHQWVLSVLLHELHSQLPAELRVLLEVEVCVFADFPVTVRVPDLIVVPAAATKANPVRYPADAVQLAVEVVSSGSVRTDKITKFAEYADVGIEHYWIVGLDPAHDDHGVSPD
jgi:Uma2 family endonuclease